MKEATGELNSTVIVVMAVAVLAAFFFSVLWPLIRSNYEANAKCSDAVCGYNCEGDKQEASEGSITCCYNKTTVMTCPYKG